MISAILTIISIGGNSFFLMTAMINNLQLAIHLPIMNFGFPQNAMIYLMNLLPIVMFDVLENQDWYQNLFMSEAAGEKIYNIDQ